MRISPLSNILMPRMSKCCDGPAPTISVKLEMPMPISSPRSALFRLLAPEVGIADPFHGQAQGARIVAAVVFPAEGRFVRELFGLDEVLLRSSAGSMPSSCAMMSTMRSIVCTASVTRNEQRYAMPPGGLFV